MIEPRLVVGFERCIECRALAQKPAQHGVHEAFGVPAMNELRRGDRLVDGRVVWNTHELQLQQSDAQQRRECAFGGAERLVEQALELPLQPVMPAHTISYEGAQQRRLLASVVRPARIAGRK